MKLYAQKPYDKPEKIPGHEGTKPGKKQEPGRQGDIPGKEEKFQK